MHVTQALRAQHLGFMFKKHWLVQGKRVPRESGAKAVLESRGVPVNDAVEFIKPAVRLDPIEVLGYLPNEETFDATHRQWNDRTCYVHSDTNVLLAALRQAQLITKSVAIDGLPQRLEAIMASGGAPPEHVNTNVQSAIMTSHVFDAQQEKLAKIKDPKRPAFNFPRVYGITDFRRNRLILGKMLFECEKMADIKFSASRKITTDQTFKVTIEKEGDLLQITGKGETFISTKRPIAPFEYTLPQNTEELLPNIFPMKHTISLQKNNIDKLQDYYPIRNGCSFGSPHSVCFHYSPLEVQNVHDLPVSDDQIKGRSLMKTFAVAATAARQEFGETVKDLPRPMVVQSVQTDGRSFYFGILQLNTLNLDGISGTMNVWFDGGKKDLFSLCAYKNGRPVLEEYNAEVIQCLNAFYQNN